MQRIKNVLGVLLVLALVMLFVSCEAEAKVEEEKKQEEVDRTLVEATLSLEEQKGMTVIAPSEVDKYQYRAIPLFEDEESGDGKIFGEQLVWRDFTTIKEGRLATMGYFRQGYWRFEIRTLNKNGAVTMTGSTKEDGDVYLQKGKDNIINVTLHSDDGEGRSGENESTGRIMFGFETNLVDNALKNNDASNKEYIRLEVDKLTIDGQIDDRKTYHDFTFPLKGGTESAKPAGKGWESYYDMVEEDGKRAVTGYADGWTVKLPNTLDTGFMTDSKIVSDYDESFNIKIAEGRVRFYAETPTLVEREITSDGTDGFEAGSVRKVYDGGIAPGNYIVRVKVCVVDTNGNEVVVGGQSMAVKVIGGETTYVYGSLLQEKYQKSSLTITLPDNASGALVSDKTGEESFLIRSDNIPSEDAKVTLTYTFDDDTVDPETVTYQWRLDGNVIEGAIQREYTYKPTSYGDHKLTCIVSTTTGESGKFGELSSATMVIRVLEKTGPNI